MAGQSQSTRLELPDGFACVECPEPVEGLAFVYILHCRNGTLYTGYTRDVRQRVTRHASGDGARHLCLLKQFELVRVEGPMPIEDAVARERQLKKWSRAKKFALIIGDLNSLKKLSRSSKDRAQSI